jgi:5'-3' exonuclease
MKALIDADSLVYKVCFAIEDKTIWNEFDVEAGKEEELDVTYDTDFDQCISTFDTILDNIMFATDTEDYLLVFSGGDNFRNEFPISYKENRKEVRKPCGYYDTLDYIKTHYNSYTTKGIEADDYVVYQKTNSDEDMILCAIDKDVLYQTVGTHYNYNKDEEVTVTEKEAIRYAYYQTLTGDTSDGYKGCKGIGPAKASKILAGSETEAGWWKAVLDAYEAAGQEAEEALWTMRLANMHQWNGSEVVLWGPPEMEDFD